MVVSGAARLLLLAQMGALSAQPGELRDAVVLGPKWAGAPRLREAPLEVELDCSGASDTCGFEVRVRVTTRDRVPAAGAFWVGKARAVTVTVDGVAAAPLDVLPTELERFEAKGWRAPAYVVPGDADLDVAVPFVVPACVRCEAPEPHDVVVRGRVRLAELVRSIPERVASSNAVEARHPFLGESAPRLSAGLVVVAPVRGIDAVRSREGLLHHGVVTTRAPATWTAEGRGDRACPQAVTGLASCGVPDVMEREDGGQRVRVGLASPLGTHLVLGARASAPPEPTWITNGGPFVGVGGALGAESGFRGRVGYDVGLGASGTFLGSLAVESDVSRTLVVAPMLHAGTRQRTALPSFGFGVGAPVRLTPDLGVGPRLRLDAKWFGAGLAADVDLRLSPSIGATVALLAEIGL